MITTENSSKTFSQPGTGKGLDGVVRVSAENQGGTGTLLYSGHHIVTAAHVIMQENGQRPDEVNVRFETTNGLVTLTSDQFQIHPGFNRQSGNFDLAIITLPHAAPTTADRYTLYRDNTEADSIATLVGYGDQGTGLTGARDTDEVSRVQAQNRLEYTPGELQALSGIDISWNPHPDSQLIADFDQGTQTTDTLGQLTGQPNYGTGNREGMIASGDSGGPAFINQQLAGIATSSVRFSTPDTDIDNQLNSSYGELGIWQKVSYFQSWIDRKIRSDYDQMPSPYNLSSLLDPETQRPDPELIPLSVPEGDTGSSLIYFSLQLQGADSNNQLRSVDYYTHDGSATAGEDYIATSGTLNLYPGETHAWIPVEVIGDTRPEDNETFHLTVYNPQGAGFAEGQLQLTATRTLLDDDGWIA